MKKVLLLGGNGYIGCRLYQHLQPLNYNVTNVDKCMFGEVYEETIVSDYDLLTSQYIQQFSHVVLLAAHSSVSMCYSLGPCFNNNVMKFIRLIEKTNDKQMLIYSSTAAVYGSSDEIMDEDKPLVDAINFYDYTKICNENIMKLYPNKNIVGLRFGSVGGFSKNFRQENLMNAISVSAHTKGEIYISNPDKLRSILGITDLCRAIETIIANEPKERIYNITSLNGKIIEFGKQIQDIAKCKLSINDALQTQYSFNCSNSKFEQDYNFKFTDTVESIYNDIVSNYGNIVVNQKRESRD
jgi:nucleoside-diphosphate-sugar epimerase